MLAQDADQIGKGGTNADLPVQQYTGFGAEIKLRIAQAKSGTGGVGRKF